MSVIPKESVKYKKEYVLKVNNRVVTLLNPGKFEHFHEGQEPIISWKWINLPVKAEGKSLNKLVIQNMTDAEIDVNMLVKYKVEDSSTNPLVYYSPSREALISYDGNSYSLFGGTGNILEAMYYSTVKVDVNEWSDGTPLNFQPLTKNSNGWGLEFLMKLGENASSFIYEWEFDSNKLQEIEDLHTQYQGLLGKGSFSY
ncbi:MULTISPECIES: hypothetical protein [Bacillaceae]|uniref:Uncharacterized protein n=1 Tax=Evansella alkalicola TaxID=745819 RepID=A0ABS6JVM1_9BACI|nr:MULTISPECIES: hypothetical protein [Bacillaceae]MBU9722440.1 hypothetical protein [Bacillus alkalicola]